MGSKSPDEHTGTWFDTVEADPPLAAERARFLAAGNEIQDALGEGWLTRELAKPLRRRHEIAVWWTVGGIPCAWNIRGLGEDLHVLREAQKFERILERLRNPRDFEAARYELHCAALVARAGLANLEFDPDVPPGKADFAFDAEGMRVFNECKKLRVSEGERGFLRMFSTLRDLAGRFVSRGYGFFELRVRSELPPRLTPVESTTASIRGLLEAFDGHFSRTVCGPVEAAIFPLRARIRPLEQPDVGVGGSMFQAPLPRLAVRLGSRIPLLWTEFEMTPGVSIDSPWVLYVECARDPREATRVENVMKDVARQFPRHTPNLLWVGTTQYQDHEALAGELRRRFARGLNRRVGGIMLTLSTVYRDHRTLNWVDWLQFVEHPNPRVQLPDISFSALGLVAQMKLQSEDFRFPADRYTLRAVYWKRITVC